VYNRIKNISETFLDILPPSRKKVAFVFFVVESMSNLGKSMSITKLLGKIGFEIFPDYEVL